MTTLTVARHRTGIVARRYQQVCSTSADTVRCDCGEEYDPTSALDRPARPCPQCGQQPITTIGVIDVVVELHNGRRLLVQATRDHDGGAGWVPTRCSPGRHVGGWRR